MTQRELARMVGVEYYTIISQVESGWGRVPPDRHAVWAEALGLEPRDFARKLAPYYDRDTRTARSGDIRRAAQARLSNSSAG